MLKQSFAWWCFREVVDDPGAFFNAASQIGYQGVELLPQELYAQALQAGLTITTESVGSLTQGLNRVENHAGIEQLVVDRLESAVEYGIPNLIVFSGNRAGLDDEQGSRNTIEGLRRLASAAEGKRVCLILELLNSKVDHPDYQCDHTSWAVDVITQVNSPFVKILYDVYHMQVMEGDIIRTIQANVHLFGHVHTAGNPGRRDMDSQQELNYPAILKTLQEAGYTGFVGHEFIPKGDPLKALEDAYSLSLIDV